MKKNYPEHIFTVCCDDFRQEVSGKITLVGLYTDTITLNIPPIANIALLWFITRVSGGEGEFKISHSLLDPKGNDLLAGSNKTTIKASPNTQGYIAIRISPLKIEKEGTYCYKVFIGKDLFHTMDITIECKN